MCCVIFIMKCGTNTGSSRNCLQRTGPSRASDRKWFAVRTPDRLANRLCRHLCGREQHVHDLAHGAVTASECCDHLATLSDRKASVRGTGAETDDAERG